MKKFALLISLIYLSLVAPMARATGDVEMMVEHLLVQAIDEYNQSMESTDPAGWVRYFTDNVRRHSPLSDQEGKKDFTDYYAWEFKNFKAKFVTKKIVVRGRSASMVLVWEAVRRPDGAPLQVDMVGVFEMATSGRIESMSLYYDTAKTAKLFAETTAASK